MILQSKVKLDEKLLKACEPFDFEFDGTVSFDVPEFKAPKRNGSWSIGLIVGPSGSGKSTLLKSNYGVTEDKVWDGEKAIASQVDYERFSAVGLNSVPVWCRPYHVLSTGEAFRARMAALLASDTSFDEFTSTIDRVVAKSCSNAIQRHIREEKMTGVVFSTCHYDVAEWLQPDWIFDTQTGQLASGRCLRRSSINLSIYRCKYTEWGMFRDHHYLSGDVNKSSRCFIAYYGDVPVAFAAAITFPSGSVKNAWRGHRTVVLPDYQGLGIGVRLSDWVARDFVEKGHRYFSKTAHPRMGEYRERSLDWKPTSKNKKARPDYKKGRKTKESGHKMNHVNRICYSHEYIIK